MSRAPGRRPSQWGGPRDIVVGITNAVTNIPDAMANAVLIGINPVHGLYALVAGTPVAALSTGSQFMTVAVTGAMALVVSDGLVGVPASGQIEALVALTVMVGAIQLALGLLKAGSLTRFVSNAVTRGFLTGVAVNIILSQVPNLTGYTSQAGNKVVRALDTALHPMQLQWQVLAVGLATIAIVLIVERTPLRDWGFVGALALTTLAVWVFKLPVPTVSSIAKIPRALPDLRIPSVGMFLTMLVPAVSVALVGLVQGAGVSRTVPNADGSYPNIDRDFIGQGLANAASGVITGVPVGGSVSSTSLVVQLGGTGRLANLLVGPIVAAVLLLFSGVIEAVPTSALAGLLILVGIRAINVPAIRTVLQTSVPSATLMVLTFAATLVMPIQYAVLLGVALSVLAYVYSASLDIRVVRLLRAPGGRLAEAKPPETLPDEAVTVLDIYGSVFYAGTDAIEKLMPAVAGARSPVVVLRLRGRGDVGSTFITFLERYSEQVGAAGGRVMLSGVGPDLMGQLERTGAAEAIGRDGIFAARPELTASTDAAVRHAEEWLAGGSPPKGEAS